MKKHRLSHEQDLCAGKHLSHFDGCDVEREGREELQRQDALHNPNIATLLNFVNSQPDPRRFTKLLIVLCKPTLNNFPD